jgi:hypothetical protein
MAICSLIFRLDYKQNFEILNQPGTIMRIISNEGGKKFWNEFQDSPQNRHIAATYLDDKKPSLFRQITVDPTTITFSIEFAPGIKLEKIGDNESFTGLSKIVKSLCNNFNIDEILRCGIRIIYFNSIGNNNPNLKTYSNKFFDDKLLGVIEKSIGHPEDYGFSFDGTSNDNIKYRLRFGPYTKDEAKKYLEHVHENMANNCEFNFICDLDLYELKFSLAQRRPIAWSKPLLEKAQKLINGLENSLLEKL